MERAHLEQVAPAKAPAELRGQVDGQTLDQHVAVRARPCEAYDQLAENLKRHGLSPLELARFVRSRVEAGECNAQIARKLAVDATTVAHHLTLLELPPVLGAALDSGRCTAPRTLHELQRLHAEQPDAVAALLASDGPVTRRAVAALRESAAASSSDPAQGGAAPPSPIANLVSRSQNLRLNPRKAHLHRWRETFAEKLRGYGIEAEASRQATRGVMRKSDPIWRAAAARAGAAA